MIIRRTYSLNHKCHSKNLAFSGPLAQCSQLTHQDFSHGCSQQWIDQMYLVEHSTLAMLQKKSAPVETACLSIFFFCKQILLGFCSFLLALISYGSALFTACRATYGILQGKLIGNLILVERTGSISSQLWILASRISHRARTSYLCNAQRHLWIGIVQTSNATVAASFWNSISFSTTCCMHTQLAGDREHHCFFIWGEPYVNLAPKWNAGLPTGIIVLVVDHHFKLHHRMGGSAQKENVKNHESFACHQSFNQPQKAGKLRGCLGTSTIFS